MSRPSPPETRFRRGRLLALTGLVLTEAGLVWLTVAGMRADLLQTGAGVTEPAWLAFLGGLALVGAAAVLLAGSRRPGPPRAPVPTPTALALGIGLLVAQLGTVLATVQVCEALWGDRPLPAYPFLVLAAGLLAVLPALLAQRRPA